MPPDGIFRHNNRTGQPVVDYAAQEREVNRHGRDVAARKSRRRGDRQRMHQPAAYSAKIEATFGVPVYDIIGLVEWFHAGLKPRSYNNSGG